MSRLLHAFNLVDNGVGRTALCAWVLPLVLPYTCDWLTGSNPPHPDLRPGHHTQPVALSIYIPTITPASFSLFSLS